MKCYKCAGCGKIANDKDETPWKYWEELPSQSAVAIKMGLVAPIECPVCKGSGEQPDEKESLSDRLRYRALAFEGAPLGKLMIEAAEYIEESEKKKE